MKRELLACRGIDTTISLIGAGLFVTAQSILAFVDYAIGVFLFACVAIVECLAPSAGITFRIALFIICPCLILILLATFLCRSWKICLHSIPVQLLISVMLFWTIGSLNSFDVVLVIHLVSILIQMVGCFLNMLLRQLKARKGKQLALDVASID